jgi:hypothetical protein
MTLIIHFSAEAVTGHPTAGAGPELAIADYLPRPQSLAAPQAVRPAHARFGHLTTYRAGELGAPTRIHTLVGAPGGPMSCLEPPIGKPPDAIRLEPQFLTTLHHR